jgi:serine/threonine protein kinase
MAPEIVMDHPYGEAVDWWALGILIFEMLFGHPPFTDRNPTRIYRMICREDIVFPRRASDQARELISGLCMKDPAMRLGVLANGAADIKAQPFFQGIDWDAVFQRKIPMSWVPQSSAGTDGSMFQSPISDTDPAVSFEAPNAMAEAIDSQLVGFTAVNERMVEQRLDGK